MALNQRVLGSSPSASTTPFPVSGKRSGPMLPGNCPSAPAREKAKPTVPRSATVDTPAFI